MKHLLIALAAGLLALDAADARVGATLEQCIEHYGKEIRASNKRTGITYHYFHRQGVLIVAGIISDSVVRMIYVSADGKRLSLEEVYGMIRDNGADLLWHFSAPDEYNQCVWYGYDMSLEADDLSEKLVLFAEYDLKGGVLTVFNKQGIVNSVDHMEDR
jgi:hypothetical protein